MSLDQGAVSATVPPPLVFFPSNVWALWAQTYQIYGQYDFTSFYFYMSTQNKWLCLLASPPPFFLGLGPLGPNLKFID